MKLKVKAEKLAHKRFEEALSAMRLWPEYQRDIAHDLLKHIQYLMESIGKLEAEIRAFRELDFLEEKKQIEERKDIYEPSPHLSKSLKPVQKSYTTRGERFYHILKDKTHRKYMNLNPSVTLADMILIANEWAEYAGLDLIKDEFFNERHFLNGD